MLVPLLDNILGKIDRVQTELRTRLRINVGVDFQRRTLWAIALVHMSLNVDGMLCLLLSVFRLWCGVAQGCVCPVCGDEGADGARVVANLSSLSPVLLY